MIKFVFTVLCTLGFTGCAMLDTANPTQRLAVQYSVIKFVEQTDVSAADVKATVAEIRTFLGFEIATLSDIKALVMERADKHNLAASDRLLLSALVDAVVENLQSKVGAGQIPADQLYKVNAVLDWILAVV